MIKRIVKTLLMIFGGVLIIILIFFLNYIVNMPNKEDPVKNKVQPADKDEYNQYGLPLEQELSEYPFYEDENYIFYIDRILRKFSYEKEQITNGKKMLSGLLEIVPKEINIYVMPIPERVVWEDRMLEQAKAYESFTFQIQEGIPDKIQFLDVLPALKEHEDEYLFSRTENSWTARGTYYASKLLYETMGIEVIPLEGYEEHMYRSFAGSNRTISMNRYEESQEIYDKLEKIPNDPFYFYLLPKSKNRVLRTRMKDGVLVTERLKLISKARLGVNSFIGSNYQWAIAEGEGKSEEKKDKTALLLCDLSGQVLTPFLAAYYEQVYVVNILYYQDNIEGLRKVFDKFNIEDLILVQSARDMGDISRSKLLTDISNQSNQE